MRWFYSGIVPKSRPRPKGDEKNGAPDRNRTCGPLLRRQLLYPLSYGGAFGRFYQSGPNGSKSTHRLHRVVTC